MFAPFYAPTSRYRKRPSDGIAQIVELLQNYSSVKFPSALSKLHSCWLRRDGLAVTPKKSFHRSAAWPISLGLSKRFLPILLRRVTSCTCYWYCHGSS